MVVLFVWSSTFYLRCITRFRLACGTAIPARTVPAPAERAHVFHMDRYLASILFLLILIIFTSTIIIYLLVFFIRLRL
jgi:hypothetical protein